MASRTSILNLAAIKLGGKTISSPTDGSKMAIMGNAIYDQIRDSLLREHPWNFAIKRVALAEDAAYDVPYGYDYAFTLPSDCLRVLEHDADPQNYKIEGRRLLSDNDTETIRYIARIDDENQMDPMFQDIFATRLAAELCTSLTDSSTLKQLLDKEYESLLTRAKFSDTIEGTADAFSESSWVNARY